MSRQVGRTSATTRVFYRLSGEGLPMWSGAVEEPLRKPGGFVFHTNTAEIAAAVLSLCSDEALVHHRQHWAR